MVINSPNANLGAFFLFADYSAEELVMTKWTVYIATETVEEVSVEAESQVEALKAAESTEGKTTIKASRRLHVHRPEED